MKNGLLRAAAWLLGLACIAPASAVDVASYIGKSEFGDAILSPTGEYMAVTLPLEETTALAIIRLSDKQVTGGGTLGRNRHVHRMWWANDSRLLFTSAQKIGLLDEPRPTGNMYTLAAGSSSAEILVGQSVNATSGGSRLRGKVTEMVWADMIDALPGDDDYVLIAVGGFTDAPITRVERMHVTSGRRLPVTRAPVRNASFLADHAGEVRVAWGTNRYDAMQTYVRDGVEWHLVNDEATTGVHLRPVGFSSDNATLYVVAGRVDGPHVIEAYDMASGRRSVVLEDASVSPYRILHDADGVPAGALFMDGRTRTGFFDPQGPLARHYRNLEGAFPGQTVLITSMTRDGRQLLVEVSSDRNPGDYYLFDTLAKKADHLLARRDWVDPERAAAMRPFALKARDGLDIDGYVTVPVGSDGGNLPMVVMPHGGPYGVFDAWNYDRDVQLLAAAGYAVLQVNYRGSGNRGMAFQSLGARQWGGTMQDDVTDATRWAIDQGIADPARICIHGGSYGAYAALMGVAKEPGLYRCASGYVGVYDLTVLHTGMEQQARGLSNWSRRWVGDDADRLAANSPVGLAGSISAPVLLAAGGQDEVAPQEHTRKMERALRAAGVPVEALYYPNEGHGFYVDSNRMEYYSRLLAFLATHIGGADATAGNQASVPAGRREAPAGSLAHPEGVTGDGEPG